MINADLRSTNLGIETWFVLKRAFCGFLTYFTGKIIWEENTNPNQIDKDRHCHEPPWKAVKMPASPVRQAICQPSAMILQTATDPSLVAGDTGFLLFFLEGILQ
jgi:hypothetical protein